MSKISKISQKTSLLAYIYLGTLWLLNVREEKNKQVNKKKITTRPAVTAKMP